MSICLRLNGTECASLWRGLRRADSRCSPLLATNPRRSCKPASRVFSASQSVDESVWDVGIAKSGCLNAFCAEARLPSMLSEGGIGLPPHRESDAQWKVGPDPITLPVWACSSTLLSTTPLRERSAWAIVAGSDGTFWREFTWRGVGLHHGSQSGQEALSETHGSCTNNIKHARVLTTRLLHSESLEQGRL